MDRSVAIVTGGTRGIGLVIAERLAQRGFSGSPSHGSQRTWDGRCSCQWPYGITINCIAPAFVVDTGIFADWSEEKKAVLKEKVLVPRLGTADDVCRAFEYLIDSPFVTGVTLDVNGGAFMI